MNRTKITIIVASIPAAAARAQHEWETSKRKREKNHSFFRTADCFVFVRNFLFVSLIPLNVALRVPHSYTAPSSIPPCTQVSGRTLLLALRLDGECVLFSFFIPFSSSFCLLTCCCLDGHRVAVGCYLHRCFEDILLEFVFSVAFCLFFLPLFSLNRITTVIFCNLFIVLALGNIASRTERRDGVNSRCKRRVRTRKLITLTWIFVVFSLLIRSKSSYQQRSHSQNNFKHYNVLSECINCASVFVHRMDETTFQMQIFNCVASRKSIHTCTA